MPYSRVLNMPGQCFTGVLYKPPVLSMPGLKICQGCEYARVTQCALCASIILNMP